MRNIDVREKSEGKLSEVEVSASNAADGHTGDIEEDDPGSKREASFTEVEVEFFGGVCFGVFPKSAKQEQRLLELDPILPLLCIWVQCTALGPNCVAWALGVVFF
ncbi:hypothetical protein U1Q18_009904 [Sarracenia purpurea var. burkii]